MNTILKTIIISTGLVLWGATTNATTGYFMHGNGVKAQGTAGASVANFVDALTIANNPAGLTWIESRIDIGATVFKPQRVAEIVNNGAGANGRYEGNARDYFVLPELAINHKINDKVALGMAIYGNGGMNTGYNNNPYAAFGNSGQAGVDLTQMFISPAVAWRYSQKQSIGIAANLLYQRFEARGLSGFGMLSTDANHLSNRGKDSSTGLGFRIGWAAQITPRVRIAANYSSKIDADPFEQYRGLFAESGDFDVPESYAIGLNLSLSPRLNVIADAQRIRYSQVDAIANPFNYSALMAGNLFGAVRGQGFGWQDINVYKIGITYQTRPNLILRAGYSYNDQPIKADQTFLNILAPGVIQQHISLGATWQLDARQELSVAYTYGLKKKLNGKNSIPSAFAAGEANIEMDQHLLGIAYGFKY
jgi:long-chain fatty acid transport protein